MAWAPCQALDTRIPYSVSLQVLGCLLRGKISISSSQCLCVCLPGLGPWDLGLRYGSGSSVFFSI